MVTEAVPTKPAPTVFRYYWVGECPSVGKPVPIKFESWRPHEPLKTYAFPCFTCNPDHDFPVHLVDEVTYLEALKRTESVGSVNAE